MIAESYRLEVLEQAYTAVIADVLDGMGKSGQVLASSVRPLWEQARLFGRARTIRVEDVKSASPNPYEIEFELVDDLGPGEVVVAQCGDAEAAFWGELLATAACGRGACGAVIDGYCRDVLGVRDLGFSVFARGMAASDSQGRCEAVERDKEICCAGVAVAPGDMVFGDYDGIVVIPSAEADEAMRRALEKVGSENTVAEALRGGMSAREAYDRWGVL